MKKSHVWMMILCCLIPVAALTAVYLLNIPLSKVIFGVLMLICPLSHVVMMKFMGHDHGTAEQHADHQHHTHSVIATKENIP
jgi:uncharacterized membrane protein